MNGYENTEAFLSGIEQELKGEGRRESGSRDYDRRDRDRDRRRRDDYVDDSHSRRRHGYDDDRDRYNGGYSSSRRGDDDRRARREDYGHPRDAYRGGGSGGGNRREQYGYDGGRSGYRGADRNDEYYGGRRDDRRSGSGGGGRGWREGPEREASPALRRSPTPPGTRAISERPRPNSKWNIPAPGFEASTPMQAKATGLFGIPGQSRSLGVPAPGVVRDAAGNTITPMGMAGAGVDGAPSQHNRQARRLYVGNIHHEANEHNICRFFNEQMHKMKFAIEDVGEPTLAAQVNPEKGYAFVEFRSANEATSAMSFDGIIFQGQSIKIRRPKDYVGPDVNPPSAAHVPGVVSTNVPDGPNKIYVGGLPTYLNEDQIMELLKSFGDLRSFNLVREAGVNGASKGFAFCEYVDTGITDLAIQGLNDMELGDKRLLVQRASVGNTGQRPLTAPMTGANSTALMPAIAASGPGEPTRAMMLLNCVTTEELIDAQEYQEIVEDMREEFSKHGRVVDMRIPRPESASKGAAAQAWKRTKDGEPVEEQAKEREGVGRVYVLFDDKESCHTALNSIAGRQFSGRTVIAAFLAEDDYPSDEDGGRDAAETSMQALGSEA